MRKVLIFNCLMAMIVVNLYAQAPPAAPAAPDTSISTKPEKSVTHHSSKIDGKIVNYTATAGTLLLKNEKDESVALYGYTAYTKDGETDATKRPVTFVYNGGPGSSSIWLHMGAVGPRRVVVNDPDNTPAAPYKLEDNANSILDVTDIVMIDPVGTGLSHAIGKAKNKDFWGVDQDIKSVSQFIKQYVTDNDRWNSPKYLLGESYGTMRSAGVVDYLQENIGMAINGVVLVSVVLDLRTLTFQKGDDISYILHVPTYAAVAWYHNKLTNKPANLEAFLKEVREFAGGEYADALMKGDRLDGAEKEQVLNKLSAYTGLSKDYLLKANLRVNEPQFTQELLRNEHQTVGRLDARYKGINQDLLSEYSDYDPQSSAISPAYTALFMNYYYGDLKVNKNNIYHVSAYGAEGFDWDWKRSRGGGGDAVTPNTGVDMADAMSKNPNLKILVLNGYYDLATPFFGTEYTMDHLGLEKKIKSNISMKYFEAGHMMYVNPTSLAQFKKEVASFILDTSK
ncbi:MAG: carboxypeptidase [Bacteroidetes bacterium]|nr:carboxypeptidase [Bacteroidota bacterium]MBS1933356.1 carboxypeptidase [Bacteroidota bacterium]